MSVALTPLSLAGRLGPTFDLPPWKPQQDPIRRCWVTAVSGKCSVRAWPVELVEAGRRPALPFASRLDACAARGEGFFALSSLQAGRSMDDAPGLTIDTTSVVL